MTEEINKQLSSLGESSTLSINQHVKQLRRDGINVIHFGFGQSPFPVPSVITDALKACAHKREYLPGQGLATVL